MSSQHGAGLEPAEPVKKRRRRTKPKESIYIKPDPTPYTPAIRPLKAARPTRQASQAVPLGEEDGAESSCMAIERAEVNDERYRVRALKAWETKRRKQQERFEALESTTWNGPLTGGDEAREHAETSFSADPFLAHLYVPEDIPKDDLLQSIHAYASRHYSVNNLLIPSHGAKGLTPHQSAQPGRTTSRSRIQSQASTPARSVRSSRDDIDDSGSEFSPGIPAEGQGSTELDKGDEIAGTQSPLDGKRKRGGQKGKRKLRDMYLALDGPALIAFGTLVQELVIQGLRQEGYVPADTVAEDSEGGFEVSDDETERENESEEQ